MAETLYTATVTSTGGGRDGQVTGDGTIDFDVRPPKEMGGDGQGVNPEALIAAAWAACFNGALQKTMKENGVDLTAHQPEVTVEYSLNKVEDGLRTSGVLTVNFANTPDHAQELVDKAHAFCPISKALRGDADLTVKLA